jgi:hypothetical protein
VGIGLRDPRSQKRDLGHPSIFTDGVSWGQDGLRLGFFQVFGAVFCEPGLVSMQERDCVFDILLRRPIGGAFTAVIYQVLEFWTALYIHK